AAVRVPGPAVEVRRDGAQARRGAAAALPRGRGRGPGPARRLRDRGGEARLQQRRLGSGERGAAGDGRHRLQPRDAGRVLRAAHARLDDRGRLARDAEEPHRRVDLRAPLRPATGLSFIDALLRPRSVALIGASDDASKTAARPLRFLRASGFAGAVYPVNARRDTVLGEKAWPSVDALPETPEHAYILAPTDSVLETLEQCAKRGVKVATILAAGFAEAGEEGVARERRLKLLAEKSGIRIVGPSSLGVVNLRNGLLLTANAAFAERDLPAGNVLVASHSGTMIGALVSRGNEADVSIGELCAATLDWPDIGGYVLFLETLRKSALLREFALAAA